MSSDRIWSKTLERAKSTTLKPFIDEKKMYCFRLDSGTVLVRYAEAEQAEAYLDGWLDAKNHS